MEQNLVKIDRIIYLQLQQLIEQNKYLKLAPKGFEYFANTEKAIYYSFPATGIKKTWLLKDISGYYSNPELLRLLK